ncbi:MAG: ATP-binding protein [Bacteroidetes bacterium]|nr:ATP-binding protein [Bacteroidota bacterium]
MNQIATLDLLQAQLKDLNLMNMARHIETHLRQARDGGADHGQFLVELTEMELRIRAQHREQRRIKDARFPLLKLLELFDFEAAPELDRRLVRELAEGEYLAGHRNIILLGKTGTGMTHLATALGIEACRQNHRVRFVTGHALANELIEARGEKELSRLIGRYACYELVIVDEPGYVPFSKESAELRFHILAERHERRSVIITTNLGFTDWTQVFDDAHMTATLLDRFTHRAHIIECAWDSYRLKQAIKSTKVTSRKAER